MPKPCTLKPRAERSAPASLARSGPKPYALKPRAWRSAPQSLARRRSRDIWNPAKAAREPREKPLANPDKPLANECGRRVHPNYDAPTLTTAGEARGRRSWEQSVHVDFCNERPLDQKSCSDFLANLQI